MFSQWVKKNLLLILTLLGVIFGVILGLLIRTLDPGETTILLLSYPGELFIRVLELMILPLVISSLIAGSSSLNAKANGKLVARTVGYFLVTSLFNAIIGIILVAIIHPGSPLTKQELISEVEIDNSTAEGADIIDGFLDMGRNMFPDNLFQATLEQVKTSKVEVILKNGSSMHEKKVEDIEGTNTLGIIVFCMIFGSVLGSLGEKGRVVVDFFTTIDDVIMKIVTGVMWTSPVGVASIIMSKLLGIDNLGLVLSSLGTFVITVIGGVFLWQLLFQNLLYFLLVRKNPAVFYFNLLEAWATAFATSSTAAALPITFRCMNEKNKVDQRVNKFVLPIGVTVNMDGTSMFVAISTIFIAQINDVHISIGEMATIAVTATATSVAVAGIPSASLVLILIVLSTMNLPSSDVSLLFTVDWLLDRVRTTNNLLGDCYTAAVVEKWSSAELNTPEKAKPLDDQEANHLEAKTE